MSHDDSDDAIHPDTPICRGCAGFGIGQHVDPRTIQIIGDGRQDYVWRYKPADAKKIERYLRVALHVYRGRGVVHAPYAVVLAAHEELLAKGFTCTDPIAPDPAWACEWCHGTGQPALSVGSMELALKGIRITNAPGAYPSEYPDQINAP